MQQLQFVSVALAMAALVVGGCVLTLKSRKKLSETDERQPSCFGLEEERGGNWNGGTAPVIKEARPSL